MLTFPEKVQFALGLLPAIIVRARAQILWLGACTACVGFAMMRAWPLGAWLGSWVSPRDVLYIFFL